MSRRPTRRPWLVPALLLAACAPDLPPTGEHGIAMPAAFTEAEGAPSDWPDAGWWQGFGMAELDRLVLTALAANSDLRAAIVRLRQADARARIAGAALLPTLDASGGGDVSRNATGAGLLGQDVRFSESYDLGLRAGWEVDLWGGNRALLLATEAEILATDLDRRALGISTTAAVAETYFRLLSLRERGRIAADNLANAERVLDLVSLRERNGAVSALDLAQQRTQVLSQRATLPALRQQERETMAALALLLGRPLGDLEVEARSLAPVLALPIRAGMPSGLLERRPDIQGSERRLEAAAADVAAARAALYPRIDLSAGAGIASDALTTLLDSGHVLTLALGIVAPIFDGGRLRAQVELSEADQALLLESYRGTILAALAEVEQALAATRGTVLRQEALAAAAVEARRAFALAEARYRAGAIGLLDLLDAQRTLLSAEDGLAQARLERLLAQVDLYRALGGGWSPAETRLAATMGAVPSGAEGG